MSLSSLGRGYVNEVLNQSPMDAALFGVVGGTFIVGAAGGNNQRGFQCTMPSAASLTFSTQLTGDQILYHFQLSVKPILPDSPSPSGFVYSTKSKFRLADKAYFYYDSPLAAGGFTRFKGLDYIFANSLDDAALTSRVVEVNGLSGTPVSWPCLIDVLNRGRIIPFVPYSGRELLLMCCDRWRPHFFCWSGSTEISAMPCSSTEMSYHSAALYSNGTEAVFGFVPYNLVGGAGGCWMRFNATDATMTIIGTNTSFLPLLLSGVLRSPAGRTYNGDVFGLFRERGTSGATGVVFGQLYPDRIANNGASLIRTIARVERAPGEPMSLPHFNFDIAPDGRLYIENVTRGAVTATDRRELWTYAWLWPFTPPPPPPANAGVLARGAWRRLWP